MNVGFLAKDLQLYFPKHVHFQNSLKVCHVVERVFVKLSLVKAMLSELLGQRQSVSRLCSSATNDASLTYALVDLSSTRLPTVSAWSVSCTVCSEVSYDDRRCKMMLMSPALPCGDAAAWPGTRP
jgi:hypothetical protein